MMRFEGKVVFITGGGSGIGREAALHFAKEGGQIAVADWNADAGEETVRLAKEITPHAKNYPLDVSQYDQVRTVVERVVSDFGKLDIALNNAGIGGKHAFRTAQHTLEDWDHVIAVNQTGVFYCMKEELRHMETQGSGSIVNISSIAGIKALPRQLSYVASKHAVIGMTKTAALEYARKGIRVNAVCPVFTNSPLLEKMFSQKEELRDKLVRTIPVGRYGEVNDIVNVIAWLCDDDSSFITGIHIPVDGGQTA